MDPIPAVLYKPTLYNEYQIDNHATVQKKDAEKWNEDWRSEVNMPSAYKSYKPGFLEVLSEFEAMWDGHLGLIKAVVHRIELTTIAARRIHSDPYQDVQKDRQFQKA